MCLYNGERVFYSLKVCFLACNYTHVSGACRIRERSKTPCFRVCKAQCIQKGRREFLCGVAQRYCSLQSLNVKYKDEAVMLSSSPSNAFFEINGLKVRRLQKYFCFMLAAH